MFEKPGHGSLAPHGLANKELASGHPRAALINACASTATIAMYTVRADHHFRLKTEAKFGAHVCAHVGWLGGAAAHVPDSDVLNCLRRWVTHACYRGSRITRVHLGCDEQEVRPAESLGAEGS